ncbi:MAG: PBP1A family penicillin-binding protein [Lactobacillales bacterium]|jgi:penicillin-binding protein 2A|nr:PBP1A family penicillin-binding protein [Lactobacillales bacterium]
MDWKELAKKIVRQIQSGLKTFWTGIHPYLSRFHQWRKRLWKKYQINKIILLSGLVVLLTGSGYLFYLAKSANVETLKSSMSTSTVVYDELNNEAGSLYGQKGTYVKLEDISPFVQEAVVSTEDRTFWTNFGIDPKGIARAAVMGVLRGGIAGGGSTITQQLAKNAYLTQKQTWDRKARELFLALEINKKYSKDDILTMYLNKAYFGNGVWGVEDASHKYFGVSAKNLTLGEAATIAGMLKGPEIYNPINYPENANARRDTVLQNMVVTNKITQQQADEQASINIADFLSDDYQASKDDYKYPSYFDAVIAEAENKYAISEKDILTKGYKIYTNLNQDYQVGMQETFANDSLFPKSSVDGEYAQGASVAMNPATGGVQALVGEQGNPDNHVFRSYNFATQMKRSPGSTIKPLVVYTPALEDGYKIDSPLEDKPQDYYPVAQNYSRTYTDGNVPMYEALADSLNLPAVYLLHKIGINRGYNEGIKFGLPLVDEDKYYGLALGGLRTGVSPWIMAQAYATFGNGGKQVEAHVIRKIVDSTGAVIVDADPKEKQITSKTVAKNMTSMMLGTFSNGTGVNANPPGYIMAGKTGTTETSFDASKTNDQWVIGYTPNVVIATWLGFEKPSLENDHYLEGSSTEQASAIFQTEANYIMPHAPGKKFSELYPNIENAFASSGQEMQNQNEDGKTDKTIDDLRDKAGEYLDKAKDAAGKVRGVLDKSGEYWEKVKDLFGAN